MIGSTVQANSVGKVLDAARRAGLDTTALLAAVDLAPAALEGPDARVPFAAFVALYEHAARLTGDEIFGLRVGIESRPDMFDVLGHAVMRCDSLEHAFATITRYLRVLQDGAVIALERDGARARASYRIVDRGVGENRHEVEATIGIMWRFLDETLGGTFRPHAIELAHAPPRDPSRHAELLRAPVRFGAAGHAIVFDAALLAHPMPKADAALSSILERHIVELIAKLPARDTAQAGVRGEIARRLERGEPAIGVIAKALAMSSRTLQRRLKDEGTSYAEILDDVRRELALRYLAEPRHAASDVAFLLGYADLTTFHRAFRRWTGETPGAYRSSVRR